MRACIIIPVHNRRETTLGCLALLKSQGVLNWATVVVVDDGSTDGTGEAVKADHPQVVILEGTGSLWWGGGIQMGMEWAFNQGAEFVLWLNDDTHPRAGALELLVAKSHEHAAITSAQGILRETGELHYGGLRKTTTGTALVHCAPGQVIPCDSICGNCVCIPRKAIEQIGFVDAATLPHFAGDADYGLRATAAGVPVISVGDAVCDCSYGTAKNRQSWLLGSQTVGDLWRLALHPLNGILSRPGITFRLRHWGLRGAFWLAATTAKLIAVTALRWIIPRPIRLRLCAARHPHHQRMEAVQRWEHQQKAETVTSAT